MNVPKALRKQLRIYIAAGFNPTEVESRDGSHWRVKFAEFNQPQFLTVNIGEPRSIQNNIARFKRLAKEQQDDKPREVADPGQHNRFPHSPPPLIASGQDRLKAASDRVRGHSMVTNHYELVSTDERGEVVHRKNADQEVTALRQKVSDLQELLDSVRRLALELSNEILEKKQ